MGGRERERGKEEAGGGREEEEEEKGEERARDAGDSTMNTRRFVYVGICERERLRTRSNGGVVSRNAEGARASLVGCVMHVCLREV